MEKSIESIWKEGFLEKDALIAPKINDLYNQKSKDIIGKFQRMFKINLVAIVVFSLIILGISYSESVLFAGIIMSAALIYLVVVGKKELDILKSLDKGKSSYHYLKSFDDWLKKTILMFEKIYRVVYPIIFLAIILGFWFSNSFEPARTSIMNNPDTYLINGVPVFLILSVVVFIALVRVFSDKIYELDMKSVYGRIMKKLKNLLTDMEELRA